MGEAEINSIHNTERNWSSNLPAEPAYTFKMFRPSHVTGESVNLCDFDFSQDIDLDEVDYLENDSVLRTKHSLQIQEDAPHPVSFKKQKLLQSNPSSVVIPKNNSKLVGLESESEPELGDPDSESELSPTEKALGIDLILEEIISYLDGKDLVATRALSHRWKYFTLKELRSNRRNRAKKVKLSFGFGREYRYSEDDDYWQVPGYKRSLKSLTQLLSNGLNLAQCTELQFPCTYFNFYLGILSNRSFQNFVTLHGSIIKKLEMTLNYSLPDFYKYCSLLHVKILLKEQVPNLQHLKLTITPFNSDKDELVCTGSWNEPLKLFPEAEDSGKVVVLKNLRIVEMWGGVHKEMLDGLIEAAVNLQEVRLDNENIIKYLTVSPSIKNCRSRIHLLKKLTIDLDYDGINTLELIASQPNLQLQKLVFHLSPETSRKTLWSRITHSLITILMSSSNTLEKMELDPVGVLPQIIFPVMKKLTKLKLVIDSDLKIPGVPRSQFFFPKSGSFNFAHTFPKLNSIYIANSGFIPIKLGGIRAFFSLDHVLTSDSDSGLSTVTVPVVSVALSVKYFSVQELPQNRFSNAELIGLRQLFPYAVFSAHAQANQ